MTETNKPLAWLLALLTAAGVVAFRLTPYDVRAYWPLPYVVFGLYAGARLRWWQSLLLVLGVQAGTDVILYLAKGWEAVAATYVSFAAVALLGRWLLASSHSPARVFAGATVGYALFFIVTNFAAWLQISLPEYYPWTLDTLRLAFVKGLEFLNPWQVFGQYAMAAAVFGGHAALAKVWFPAEVVSPETAR